MPVYLDGRLRSDERVPPIISYSSESGPYLPRTELRTLDQAGIKEIK